MFLKKIFADRLNIWHLVFALTLILYGIFYSPYIFGGKIIKGGDAESLHYPGIYYLKEKLSEGKFPFYSERIFSGFPVYENSEFAYLNPLRIFFVLIFNPEWVLKVEHILFFVLGTVGMLMFSKKIGFSPAGYLFAHSVYFYSIQSVARFTHTNIIYVYFLVPLCLYFLEKFIDEKKKKWIFYLALVNVVGIYYGNYNAVLISLMIQGIFYGCSVNLVKQYKEALKFALLLLLWTIALSIPILVTSGALYLTSARGSGGLSYAQGSASGLYVLLNLFHPYPFGFGDSYIGDDVKNTWLFHENSIYGGLSVLVISFIGALFIKDRRFRNFYIINFLLFILLATINYSPIGKLFNFFPISLFRYWVRYAVVFHFASALLGGALISGFETVALLSLREMLKNFLAFLIPFGFLIFLTYYNLKSYTSTVLIDYLISVFPGGILYKRILAVIAVFTLFFLVMYLRNKRKIFAYLLAVIAGFDVMYFSYLALVYNLEPKRDLINRNVMETSKILQNERVVYLDKSIKGNTPLYYKTWGLFGYSVSFEQKNYTDFLDQFEMSSRRFKEFIPEYLDKFGTKAFIYEDGSSKILDSREDLIFSGEGINVKVNSKNEGEFLANIKSDTPKEVYTKIRNFPGWKVFINGKEEKFSNAGQDVFLKFWVNGGESNVKLKYYPVHLYYSFLITAISLIVAFFVHRKTQFNNPV